MTDEEVIERVTELVEPLAEDVGVELVDVERAGGILRVTVDRAEGLDLDRIASLTRAVSNTLDEHDPVPGRYTLEVSSPGLERPLRTPRHFARAVGQKVTIKTRPGVEGPRRVHGELIVADDDGIVVALEQPDADGASTRSLRFHEIERARTVFEWGSSKPTKPGRS